MKRRIVASTEALFRQSDELISRRWSDKQYKKRMEADKCSTRSQADDRRRRPHSGRGQ
jgi:hypothetical protein